MLRRKLSLLILVWVAIFVMGVARASAQTENQLTLKLARNFGYSSGTGDIQGNFTLSVSGPEDLQRVIFFIDGEVMAEVNAPPFEHKFSTGQYPNGVHTLSAIGYTAGGAELRSNEQKRRFLSSEEAGQNTLKFLVPLLGVVFGMMFFAYVLPLIVGRGKKRSLPLGAPRNYGVIGGAICPKCGRPFGMHIWGLNMVVGKFDRCPYCGKWSIVRRASPQALHEAELAELANANEIQIPAPSLEEDLKKELEDSRYQDL